MTWNETAIWFSANSIYIDRAITSALYPWCYALAFMLGGWLLWREGRRRGVSMANWMLLMSSAVFLMIAGTRLGTFDFTEWQHWWTEGTPIKYGRKTAVGGLLFGFLGLWLVRSFLGFRTRLWDAFAVYLPLTLILHRIGCLFAGCCSGLPTDLSWGVVYQGPGWLRDIHELLGHIPAGAAMTAPVHPVPVYEMLTSLGILAILFAIRKRILPDGSRILLSVGLMLVARIFLEFLREPMGNFSMGSSNMGLKTVQWICLGLLALVSLRLWHLVSIRKVNVAIKDRPVGHRHWILMLAMLTLVLKGDGFFTDLERLVMFTHLLPTLGLMLIASGMPYGATWSSPFLRIAFPSLLVLLFAGMYNGPVAEPDSTGYRNTSFYMRAHRMELPTTKYPCYLFEQGCWGPYCAEKDLYKPIGPGYTIIQGGIEHVVKSPKRKWSWVIGGDAQIEQFRNDTSNYHLDLTNLHLYGGIEGDKNVGFRLGLRTGRIMHVSNHSTDVSEPFASSTARIWFGYRPWVVVQFGLYDPISSGMSTNRAYGMINANAGLISPRLFGRMRLGMADLEGYERNYFFWDLDVRLGRHFEITPSVTWYDAGSTTGSYPWGFGAGIKYTMSKPY